MTSERHVWVEQHRFDPIEQPRLDTCACGQELDTCTRHHCPRCGASLATHAA